MPKSARLTGIKSLRCYTIPEAADVTGVTNQTIRKWIKQGLPVLAAERPALVRGDDLIAFIKRQRAERKIDLLAHQFLCLKCSAARNAAGGFATCRRTGPRMFLQAICEKCDGVMNKPFAESRLSELRKNLELIDDG
ncbi:helix-turn-helix domain-containing protein [Cognatiyoonia sp. IB215446]|uniref:helix-turn-helix domain-containing protein n=1 Tax=Cognatiyoonia sp. IB215446 TaxID=3097355 RepID=UPI002A0B3162|nr:helix-turn-helix domain-containing protein [Cognatiyoonia sp. IB215446]MDX8347812.1 helix-turn-helix domain-containing protein [Cognatiyoonia sp. IB215446]